MTENDIDLGTFNIAVGFAPQKTAKFVAFRIEQHRARELSPTRRTVKCGAG